MRMDFSIQNISLCSFNVCISLCDSTFYTKSLFFCFFLQLSSTVLSLGCSLYINPLHFLVCNVVISQLSCDSS